MNAGCQRALWFPAGLLAVLSSAAPARGQDVAWGATVDISPVWVMPDMRLFVDSYPIDYRGSDIRVGVVRGAERGGNWGISFVRKHGTNTRSDVVFATVIDISSAVDPQNVDQQWSTVTLRRTVTLTGVEVHRFTSFTKSKPVQIGLEYGGGVAGKRETLEWAGDRPGVFPSSAVLLARIEAVAGVRVAPGAMVTVKGGIGLPGALTAAVSFSYFFVK